MIKLYIRHVEGCAIIHEQYIAEVPHIKNDTQVKISEQIRAVTVNYLTIIYYPNKYKK